MRPVFCGNFDYDTRQYDLEGLFSKDGPIRRIDMKSGYAFIYFEDERDAEDAIRHIEKHFEPYGKIANIRVRRNFAFVRYETQEEATAAVKNTDKSTILDRVITVEYAFRDDDNERDDRYGSPKQGAHDRRRGNPYMRSPSPRYRKDYSPDYNRRGRYPGYDRRDGAMYDRRSPAYDRYSRGRSPVYDRYDRRRSPVYDQY
ncbi:hypothetical protein SETIT_9G568700v2 [Setaria italica]|uniref:RRM domain-containing protein n=1 Tax=Setaria italica TaxID=4555 RepID=A0A368SWZ1_SETIT|nr:hypothetical protein SETIT_9G568700v2 [Setaria italica]